MTTYPTPNWGDSLDTDLYIASIAAGPLGSLAPISPFNLTPIVEAPADLSGIDWAHTFKFWFGSPVDALAEVNASINSKFNTPDEMRQRASDLVGNTVAPIKSIWGGVVDAVTGTVQGAEDQVQAQVQAQAMNVALIGGAGLLAFLALQKLARH